MYPYIEREKSVREITRGILGKKEIKENTRDVLYKMCDGYTSQKEECPLFYYENNGKDRIPKCKAQKNAIVLCNGINYRFGIPCDIYLNVVKQVSRNKNQNF